MPTLDLARSWYDQNDPVHGWGHIERVLRMAEHLAGVLNADLEIVRAASLLHDVADAAPDSGEGRQDHELTSAVFAAQVLSEEGWAPERVAAVAHCIRAHRFRSKEQPASLEARVLFDADKLDVLGAFGVGRTIGYALQAGEPLFAEPSQQFLSEARKVPGEPHSAYHEYLFKLRWVKDRLLTDPARAIAEQRARFLNLFFEQLAHEARGQIDGSG